LNSYWNCVRPTVHMFDGRSYTVPDFVAFNLMHSGSACTYIKYCFCVHPDLVQSTDPWQCDDFWSEWINMAQAGETQQVANSIPRIVGYEVANETGTHYFCRGCVAPNDPSFGLLVSIQENRAEASTLCALCERPMNRVFTKAPRLKHS
jgi:hypothetical protein